MLYLPSNSSNIVIYKVNNNKNVAITETKLYTILYKIEIINNETFF